MPAKGIEIPTSVKCDSPREGWRSELSDLVKLGKAVVIVAGVPNAGSACGRVAVQGVIMRGCPLAPVRGPSQLAPRCENLHRTGLAGRLRATTLSDLGRHRTRFGNWDGVRSTNTTAHAEVRALSLLPLRASATSRRRPMPRWLARRSEPR